MTGPAWLAPGLAVLMLLIAAASAARLLVSRLRGRRTERDTDALHIVMGLAMAGMLEPRLSPVSDVAWTAVFAAAAAWFTWRAVRVRVRRRAGRWNCVNPAPHVVECAAMMYMLVPGRMEGHGPAMAMPGMSVPAAANPAVALLLALFMLGYIVWTADQVTARSRASALTISERNAVTSDGPGKGGALALGPAEGPANLTAVVLAPRLAACYKIGMSIAMGYMLIAMV
jgi:Domain of unknown function (DUF5134)